MTKGLDGSALRTIGYGTTRLVRPGAQGTADGAELNRRVTFVIETPAGAATVAALSGADTPARLRCTHELKDGLVVPVPVTD